MSGKAPEDCMGRPVPAQPGWYWAKHKYMGWVITNLTIVDGKPLVMDQGYTGWNVLIDQFDEWGERIPDRVEK